MTEERSLSVFQNKVLRKMCGTKGDKVTGDWRRLHNEELYDLYSSPNIIRVIKKKYEMGGACSMCEGEMGIHGFGGEPEGRRPLGRPRRRWEDNFRVDL
jgi:hypothetical protein